MQRHWARFGPPVYIAVALYFGLGRPSSPAAECVQDPEQLAAFLSAFPGASSAPPVP